MKLNLILALVGVSLAAALPLDAPEPVVDTAEVAQAKAEFQTLYDAAAAAAEAGELPEVVVPEGAPAPVADTDEVAAAKANFQAAFDAAAAAAEAAPDHDLDGSLSTYTGFLSGVDGRLSPYYTNTLPFGAYGLHAPVLARTPYVAGAHSVVAGSPLVKSVVAGSPLVAGAHPFFAGSHLLAGAHHTIAGTPLAYNGLGLGGFGYGYTGLHTPFVQVVAKEE